MYLFYVFKIYTHNIIHFLNENELFYYYSNFDPLHFVFYFIPNYKSMKLVVQSTLFLNQTFGKQ